jgi:hypothetical protein
MKVLAVKGIEKDSNVWLVRYTRQHGKNVQDAVFFCDTPEEAKQKYKELLDIARLPHRYDLRIHPGINR